MAFVLIYTVGTRQEERVLDSKSISVGRGADNDIVLTDFSVSRKHCRIFLKGEKYHIEDAGSRNGTMINGKPVKKRALKPGDEISLGRFPMRFVDGPTPSPTTKDIVMEDRPFMERPGTIIRPMSSLFEDPIGSATKKNIAAITEGDEPEVSGEDQLANILQILSQVAKTLISADSLEEILRKVMDLTFEHLPVERGFLMLHDEEEQKLLPTVVKQRSTDQEQKHVISKTISEKVFNEHVSILTSDASIDPRFSGSESIIVQGIRSAMCVPLWNEGEVVGVLHVDSLMANKQFVAQDLDFLTALANYAAVAIQRARLHERVQQESEARAKLARYHSPNVVTKILASKDAGSDWNIDAQEREVSVLFSDIVGFTTLSEHLEPHQVGMFLNHYFGRMTEIIFRHEGTLDKFIGDAIMAVFGAPINQKDHALRAVNAALEMRDCITGMNISEELDLDIDLHVRIGINSGTVVAGDIGSPQRMEYTVIGDTVNAASRLEEDVASPDEVVVGEDTWKPIKDDYEFEELDVVNLRGREGAIRCFRVLKAK